MRSHLKQAIMIVITTFSQTFATSKTCNRTIYALLILLFTIIKPHQITQAAKLTVGQQQTADLTLLINETLAINNKTIPNSHKPIVIKDDWTFDRVEYDLIEFLQDLGARYKLSLAGNEATAAAAAATTASKQNCYSCDEPLEAKSQPIGQQEGERQREQLKQKGEFIDVNDSSKVNYTNENGIDNNRKQVIIATNETNLTTSSLTPAPNVSTSENIDKSPESQQSSSAKTVTTTTTTTTTITTTTNAPEIAGRVSSQTTAPILLPNEPSDSADLGSRQYGIFDRFTRPKSTSTTRDPYLTASESSARLEVKNFNSEECGLRTYSEVSQETQGTLLLAKQDSENEASKELNQRRQRPPTLTQAGYKKHQPESVSEFGSERDRDENIDEQLTEWDKGDVTSNSDTNGSEALKPPSGDHGQLGDHTPSDQFNLAIRRQWMQQQLENTLQMLGFNASSQSAAEFLNETSGLSVNTRENMMKKHGMTTLKASKSLAASAFEPVITEQELIARQDEMKLEARVIGGSDARLGDSPWSVSLQALVSRPGTGAVEYRHYCGGTIIAERYILTAAHCLDFMLGRESRLFVVIGDLNWRMSTASLHGRRFGIEKLIIHSGYKSTAFGHDIGLIRTKESIKPLKVNGKYIINSVCLPERGVEHSGEAELVGWGLFSNRNEMADSLQIADLPILPRPLCVDLYKRRTGLIQWLIGIELITEKQVCAGTFGRGICQGDSGSALVVNEKITSAVRQRKQQSARTLRADKVRQTRATIIGVVAFGGIRRCSYQSLPGVYMQTSKYMDWILPRIQE